MVPRQLFVVGADGSSGSTEALHWAMRQARATAAEVAGVAVGRCPGPLVMPCRMTPVAMSALCRAFADDDFRCDETFSTSLSAGPRHTQRSPGASAGAQFAAQRTAALNIERLGRSPRARSSLAHHRRIDAQAVGDLLGTPRGGAPSILAAPVSTPDPADIRTDDRLPVGGGDLPGQPVLHVAPQRLVGGELDHLRSTGTPIRMPLRSRGPVG